MPPAARPTSVDLPNRQGINAFLSMAIAAGMISAIMNPVGLPVPPSKIAAIGLHVPEDMDDETFCQLFALAIPCPALAAKWQQFAPRIFSPITIRMAAIGSKFNQQAHQSRA